MYKGIDVSQWQGAIDWEKVAAAGIQFAIIRCAKQDLSVDPYFERNYDEATSNGLAVGAYKYSYATTVEAAEAEAKATLEALKGREFGAKVWLDLEDKCQQNLDKELLYQIVKKWLEIVAAAGYKVGIYCNQYWYKSILTDKIKSLTKNFWIAKWSDKKPELGEVAWQYSSEGKVDGINGNTDMNYYYAEFDVITTEEWKPTLLLPNDEIADEVIAGKWGNGTARKEALEAAGYDYETVQDRVNELILESASAAKPTPLKSVDKLAEEVILGRWGNGTARKEALEAAGYDYKTVQDRVNELILESASTAKPTPLKSVDKLAEEVILGRWGNGSARKEALEKAGYDYEAVQAKVNELLASTEKEKKGLDEVAREVINGKWGNGSARREALEKAGYDYETVQKRVNELLK